MQFGVQVNCWCMNRDAPGVSRMAFEAGDRHRVSFALRFLPPAGRAAGHDEIVSAFA